MNGMALCAGAGGLELGLRLALGDDYRCVLYVEREAYAAAVLVARMEDKTLDRAPVWDDLTTIDSRPWRGVVDIVSAGFPCQPWSVAGKRQGTDDDRWLWPDIARVIHEVRPGYVFLENVPQLVRGGLEHVLGDLATMGFDAEWDVLSAGNVGAPQGRQRLFILAYSNDPGREERRQPVTTTQEYPPLNAEVLKWPTPMAADGGRSSDRMMRGNPSLTGASMRWPTPTAMDSHSSGGRGSSQTLTDATVRSGHPEEMPATKNGGSGFKHSRVLNPQFCEALMGWPIGGTACESLGMESCRWLQRWRSYISEIV